MSWKRTGAHVFRGPVKLGDHGVLSGWVRAVVNFSHHFFCPVGQYYPYPLTTTDEIMNDSSESEVQQ